MDVNLNLIVPMSIVITALMSIIALTNHKRIRSKCCQREIVASIDIENTTPPPKEVKVEQT
jgi:hypothetical protein